MRFTIGKKLGLGFVFVIAILLIGAMIGVIQLNQTIASLKRVSQQYFVMSIESGEIRMAFDEIAWSTKNIFLRGGDQGVIIAEQAIMDDRRRLMDEKSAALKKKIDDTDPQFASEISNLYTNYQNELKYFDEGWSKALPVFKVKGMLPADDIMKGRGRRVVASLKTLDTGITDKSTSELEKAIRLSTSSILITIISMLIGVFISIIVSIVLSNKIRKSVTHLATAAEKISLGQLDEPIEAISKDEFADLASAFDRMRISFKKSMERLKAK